MGGGDPANLVRTLGTLGIRASCVFPGISTGFAKPFAVVFKMHTDAPLPEDLIENMRNLEIELKEEYRDSNATYRPLQ